jgi:DNA-binding transcriptional LysR family regulator
VTRRIGFIAPNFTSVLATVAASDLVTTMSRAYAERFATAFDLAILDPPFPATDLTMTFVWHALRSRDPLVAWVRGLFRAAADDVFGPLGSSPLNTP